MKNKLLLALLMAVAVAAKGQDSSAKSKNDTVYLWRLANDPFKYVIVSNEDTPLSYSDYEKRRVIECFPGYARFITVKKKKRLFKRKTKKYEK